MMLAAWIAIAFLSGALPFSVWIGRLALRADIRAYGDGNPGATNVLRAGGRGWGALALALDYLKGAVPIGCAHLAGGLTAWPLVAVALAPVCGHAWSPFLKGRGGKAVAVTFGVWTGLTIWEGPTVLGLLVTLTALSIDVAGWAVLLAMIGMLVYFVLTPPAINGLGLRAALVPDLLATWVGNILILAWKHRAELAVRPRLRRRRRGTPASRSSAVR